MALTTEASPSTFASDCRRSFDEFAAVLHQLTGTDLSRADPASLLGADLGWDSLTMVEVLGHLDTLGVSLPEDLVGELTTLGDLYHYVGVLETSNVPGSYRRGDGLCGPNVSLVPVTARDQDWLFGLCATGRHLIGYRLRAMTPGPDAFHRFLWDRILAQFLVVTRDNRPIGLVSSFEPDFRNRYAYLAAVAHPDWHDSGLVLEGMTLLISYLFDQFDLRKLYAESLESNYAQFDNGAQRIFNVEGRLRDHEYINGGYEDFVVLAIWRDTWRAHHDRVFGPK